MIVTDVPEVGYDVLRFYWLQTRFPSIINNLDIRPTIAEYNERQREVKEIVNELKKLQGVTIVHPESMLFDEKGKGRIIANGELLYRDDDHLSSFGSRYVAHAFDDMFNGIASIHE